MHQKLFFISVVLSLLLSSCKVNEHPTFIKVTDVDITDYSSKEITLKTDLLFENPNILGGILQANDIHVFVNEMDLGTVNTPEFEVPAKSKFNLPFTVKIPYDKIWKQKENLLDNLLSTLVNNKLNLQYKGNIHYKNKLFSYDYPLDYRDTIILRKK